ncbi:hypothetical protein GCM10029963_79810 [Micromonospora andamanensis]
MDSEISEFQRRASAAVMAAIQAAGQIAQLLIDARIAELQRAARASEDRARRARAQARAAQQADAAVWRQAIRTSWWRRASADDIARAWRASATWSAVDPRAREAQRVMTDRLAARGVHVDPKTDMQPENADWLADQLDQAAVESTDPAPDAAQSAATTREPRRTARQRQEEMADYVRQVWSPDRAERVIHSEAWPALAYKLDQLARAGHDVPDLLRQVPGFIDRAHTPAAYAFRAVDDYATDQAAAGERAAAAKEHPSVTLDGEWSEASGTVPGATAAYANTDSAIGGAIEPDVRAAQLAGRAFPRRPDLWSRTLRLRSLQRQRRSRYWHGQPNHQRTFTKPVDSCRALPCAALHSSGKGAAPAAPRPHRATAPRPFAGHGGSHRTVPGALRPSPPAPLAEDVPALSHTPERVHPGAKFCLAMGR